MIYTLENYDEAYNFVTTHEGYTIKDLGNGTYEVVEIPPLPEPTIEEQNEAIRKQREEAFIKNSDVLFMEYQEDLARGLATAEKKKLEWLASKDKIRAGNPYIQKK